MPGRYSQEVIRGQGKLIPLMQFVASNSLNGPVDARLHGHHHHHHLYLLERTTTTE